MLMKMRGQMKKGRNQKGFTLVELMVVVVIIGVLSAIAVPVYSSVTEKAAQSAHDANLRTIDGAIMLYLTNNDGAGNPEITDLDLQTVPEIPAALKGGDKPFGDTDEYFIDGDPLRAWPVGTWENAYRKDDTVGTSGEDQGD